jgi:hypothetical protein
MTATPADAGSPSAGAETWPLFCDICGNRNAGHPTDGSCPPIELDDELSPEDTVEPTREDRAVAAGFVRRARAANSDVEVDAVRDRIARDIATERALATPPAVRTGEDDEADVDPAWLYNEESGVLFGPDRNHARLRYPVATEVQSHYGHMIAAGMNAALSSPPAPVLDGAARSRAIEAARRAGAFWDDAPAITDAVLDALRGEA